MTITPHFTLEELTSSATATRKGIDNSPSTQAVINLALLCVYLLEPIRSYAGRPIVITSGYRCKALNTAVGGVAGSYHLTGHAADIRIKNREEGKKLGQYAATLTMCDKALLECPAGKNPWLHVQWSATPRKYFSIIV